MKNLSLIISLIALVGVGVLLVRSGPEEADRKERGPAAPSAQESDEEHHDEIEVAIVMGRIQRFHQKYWLAVRGSNAELAQFYLHEMEEAMEEITEAKVVDEGIDISANMRTYGLEVNEHLQKKLKEEGLKALEQEGDLLVKSCNACHDASGYGLIEIRVPGEFNIPDQVMGATMPDQKPG